MSDWDVAAAVLQGTIQRTATAYQQCLAQREDHTKQLTDHEQRLLDLNNRLTAMEAAAAADQASTSSSEDSPTCGNVMYTVSLGRTIGTGGESLRW